MLWLIVMIVIGRLIKAHHNSGELAREPKLSDGQVRFLAKSGFS